MKKLFAIILITLGLTSFGQNNDIKSMVDSIQFIKTDILDCSADLYWRIIARGDKAIPILIDKLTDTTMTNVSWHCKKDRLNVGEIAHFALDEIMFLPTAVITNIQFDVIVDGCWTFYDYFFANKNKITYQKILKDWYSLNAIKYKPVKISTKKLSKCKLKYNIDTYYDWEN